MWVTFAMMAAQALASKKGGSDDGGGGLGGGGGSGGFGGGGPSWSDTDTSSARGEQTVSWNSPFVVYGTPSAGSSLATGILPIIAVGALVWLIVKK